LIIRIAPLKAIGEMWQETMLLLNNPTFFYVEKQAGKEKNGLNSLTSNGNINKRERRISPA